ncbi:hypothetical protein PAMP_017075 [Pampus punctatissimus]
MAPQLYITMYKEQFASPGRAKRAQLRPSSAHRRNNPQPRPDFLFPRSLQPSYRSSHTVDSGRPLFPPVRHLSFHSPVKTCPDNSLNTVETMEKVQHMPPVNPAAAQALPSADGLHKQQPPVSTDTQLRAALKNPPRMDYQRYFQPLSAQQLR